MTLFIWLLFGLAVVEGLSVKKGKGDGKELRWASQFKLSAKRMSLTSNLIEDSTAWKTSRQSRIDYNNGVVKSLVTTKDTSHRYGIKYMVHPEALLNQETKTVCYFKKGLRGERLLAETILPEVFGFEAEGQEIMNDKECTKFVNNYKDDVIKNKHTIWATYDDESKEWIPVRYEALEFNEWLGSKHSHEVWDFYDYSKKFSYRTVFNVDTYNCTEYANFSLVTDSASKHLLFMDPEKDAHVDHVFETFKKNYNRKYDDANEHDIRRSIFKRNMRRIVLTNRQNLGYKLSINNFADKTPDEMKKYMGLHRRPEGKVGTIPFPYSEEKLADTVDDLPKEHDARLLGLVTNVKSQEECSSCWSFGATAAVEGALAKVNGGRLVHLSSQALIDCAWAFGAQGCNGGRDTEAYEWMMQYGLPTVAEYGPYINKDGVCNILNMTKIYPIRGFTDVTPLSIGAIKVALVNHGPLSVSVYASEGFGLYSSGIFYDITCDVTELNHEMALVGYGERDGDTFWILKNSWGPMWGIDGYMYISARDNVCGVATEPTYAVI